MRQHSKKIERRCLKAGFSMPQAGKHSPPGIQEKTSESKWIHENTWYQGKHCQMNSMKIAEMAACWNRAKVSLSGDWVLDATSWQTLFLWKQEILLNLCKSMNAFETSWNLGTHMKARKTNEVAATWDGAKVFFGAGPRCHRGHELPTFTFGNPWNQ